MFSTYGRRVSRSLNYAGHTVSYIPPNLTVSGSDDKWYIYRVAELIKYLERNFGPPDSVLNSKPFQKELGGGKGNVMRARIAWSVLCLVVAGCATGTDAHHSVFNEEKYAVSYCLAQAYPDSEMSRDARYVAGAYLQNGESGIDVYERVRAFVDEYREEPYLSKHEVNLRIMQCLDLISSAELAQAISGH